MHEIRLTPLLRGGSRTLCAGLILLLCGCAGTVTRPDPNGEPGDRQVFLLDHGRHSSLVLSRTDGSLVRYAYGEWLWYAEGRSGFWRALPTLFTPTRSTLGRRQWEGSANEAAIRSRVRVEIRSVHPLLASGHRVDALDRRLQVHFDRHAEQPLYNARFDLEFVPGYRPYTLWHNSNHVVADWLAELGLDVRGNPVFGKWQVRPEP